jgi:uncharacterized protein
MSEVLAWTSLRTPGESAGDGIIIGETVGMVGRSLGVRTPRLIRDAAAALAGAAAVAERQRATLAEREHRTEPLPEGPWVNGQTWTDLLFAHWRVPPERMAPLIPNGLELDTFDGAAWVAIAPFALSGLRARLTPPVPPFSRFLETNIRTYVSYDGRPGVLFFRLLATSRFAVASARALYHLPYVHATGTMASHGGTVSYAIQTRGGSPPASMFAEYRATGEARVADPGSLEHFLVERYCLYTRTAGRLLRVDIHHPPWTLQPGEGRIEQTAMLPPELGTPDGEPLLHVAGRQDVLVWRPVRVEPG